MTYDVAFFYIIGSSILYTWTYNVISSHGKLKLRQLNVFSKDMPLILKFPGETVQSLKKRLFNQGFVQCFINQHNPEHSQKEEAEAENENTEHLGQGSRVNKRCPHPQSSRPAEERSAKPQKKHLALGPLNKRERCATELEDARKKACSCLINNLRQDLHFWFSNV